jgi:hypothetical protein
MGFLGLFLRAGSSIYLYMEAPKHYKNRWLWSIFGLIFGLITLGIFFIKTDRKRLGWILTVISALFYLESLFTIIALVIAQWTISQ